MKKEITCPNCKAVFKPPMLEPGDVLPFSFDNRFKCPKCQHKLTMPLPVKVRVLQGIVIAILLMLGVLAIIWSAGEML